MAKWEIPRELLVRLKEAVERTGGSPIHPEWMRVEEIGNEILMKCAEAHLGRKPTWSPETWKEDTEAFDHCRVDHNIPDLHHVGYMALVGYSPQVRFHKAFEPVDDILLAWIKERLKKTIV